VNAGIKYKVHEDLTNLASLDKKKSKKDSKYSILTPSNSSNSYKFNRKLRVDRVYNVVESVEIPSIDYTKVVTPREDVRVVKRLMPQHFATGYNKSEGDVCTDDEAELPKQKKQKMEADGVKVKKDKKEKKEKKEKKDKKDKKKEKKEKK
jgi:DNA-directed RNA polymerase I subunit RPA34